MERYNSNAMMRRVTLGSSYERVGDGASPTMKPRMKNTSEQLTEKQKKLSRFRRH